LALIDSAADIDLTIFAPSVMLETSLPREGSKIIVARASRADGAKNVLS
jgi:hypothetical protein